MVDHAVIEIQVLSLHLVYKVEQRLEHRISTIAVCDVLGALVAAGSLFLLLGIDVQPLF